MARSAGFLFVGGKRLRCARAHPLPHLSKRPFRALAGGSLLEFPPPRSDDRGALVSSSLPSLQSLGGCLALPVKVALSPDHQQR